MRGWLLRRPDQAVVAALAGLSLAAIATWWIAQGGWRGRLVEPEGGDGRTARFEVDLNAADWPELVPLPGIGETLARRIVDSRKRDGPFRDHEDLQRVPGIGPKKLEQVRPYLCPMPGRGAAAVENVAYADRS